tara:strand:+ start:303 stop:653 length:351 start_codon:yes stop_codon:yes gene_type:complete
MECITDVENSSMTFDITDSDKKDLRSNYDVMVLSHDCKPETIDKKKFPNNAVLVKYEIDGVVKYDHAVAPKNVNVFDAYYDLLKTVGGKILTMETMYGMMNPKLWNNPPTPPKKKK